MHQPVGELPQLRFEIIEAARILRMSRATLYERIRAGGNQGAEGWSAEVHHCL